MTQQIHIFDRTLVRNRRDRAAAGFAQHNAVHREAASLLLERIDDVKQPFTSILDLGAHDGAMASALAQRSAGFVVAADLSYSMLRQGGFSQSVVADEEFLPFAPASFDLIVSNLSLHWVNDLPGTLAQIKRCLRPNGLFLATLLGGETLHELRSCLLQAELALAGGIRPRLSPSIDLQTASALLQRAGFTLPVTDQELITLTYSDSFALMRDLRGMAETNAQHQRPKNLTGRRLFARADHIYRQGFARGDGRLPATLDVIFLHGWA